jgi:hypothetical protein
LFLKKYLSKVILNMPRKTKRPYKRNKSRKLYKKVGGLDPSVPQDINEKLDHYQIQNVEVILFLIDFLDKSNLKNILLGYHKFINTIETQKLDFTNPEFREFCNSLGQWFLFDYNKDFSNGLLEIIKNTIGNQQFFNKKLDWDQRYNILLLNVYDVIKKYEESKDIEFITLFRILLRALRIPSVKESIVSSITAQQDALYTYENIIVCLLNNLIKKDMLHNEEVRKLLSELITELTYKNVYNWAMIKKLSGMVGNCAGSVTYDLGAAAAVGTAHATKNAVVATGNLASSAASGVYNSLFVSKK